jgi:hypothetical protein
MILVPLLSMQWSCYSASSPWVGTGERRKLVVRLSFGGATGMRACSLRFLSELLPVVTRVTIQTTLLRATFMFALLSQEYYICSLISQTRVCIGGAKQQLAALCRHA